MPDSDYSCDSLWQRIQDVYVAAQASGAATLTETDVAITPDTVNFVLRVIKGLRNKPEGAKMPAASTDTSTDTTASPVAAAPKPSVNPFLPYEEALWVQHVSPTHTVLLNKYNIVPHHVLIVTRSFESQSNPLNSADLDATWRTMQVYPTGALAYFNSGEHSGRSQPHKHLQVIPVDASSDSAASASLPFLPIIRQAAEREGAKAWEPFELRDLPFRSYVACLPADPTGVTGEMLSACTDRLTAAAEAASTSGEAVSYNWILTPSYMQVVPRSAEQYDVCSINSMGYAGSLLLKTEEAREFVRHTGPMLIISSLGFQW